MDGKTSGTLIGILLLVVGFVMSEVWPVIPEWASAAILYAASAFVLFFGGGLFFDWWERPQRVKMSNWSARPAYRLYEASYLWYGFEPPHESGFRDGQPLEVNRIHRELNDANGRKEFPNAKSLKDHLGRDSEARLVPREDLIAWAQKRGERPAFLFPGGPSDRLHSIFSARIANAKQSLRQLLTRNWFGQSADK